MYRIHTWSKENAFVFSVNQSCIIATPWGVNAWKKKTCNLKPPNLYVLYIISFRDWVDFANHIVISSFVFILEERKRQEGNLFLIYLF